MPITRSCNRVHGEFASETLFKGRVVKVEQTTENRNWSDTLDYSDWRSTKCTWALVWLGANGHPPANYGGRDIAPTDAGDWLPATRDLRPHEQFAWVDCTNMFSDRNDSWLTAKEDSPGDQLLNCGPAMWDAYIEWKAYQENTRLLAEATQRRRELEAQQAEAIVATKRAKKESEQAALKSAAEKLLCRIPAKGTTVTIDNFKGKIFWIGVSKYRNKWNARAGVKNARGEVIWVAADKF